MARASQHNEWFRSVSLGNRKSCPSCGEKLGKEENIWSWGEYVGGRWYTVKHFCKECYPSDVAKLLSDHTGACGCSVQYIGYRGEKLPQWLS